MDHVMPTYINSQCGWVFGPPQFNYAYIGARVTRLDSNVKTVKQVNVIYVKHVACFWINSVMLIFGSSDGKDGQ